MYEIKDDGSGLNDLIVSKDRKFIDPTNIGPIIDNKYACMARPQILSTYMVFDGGNRNRERMHNLIICIFM